MGWVVGDEGDVEEDDARVDGQEDALPLRERGRAVRARRGGPAGQDERGDGGSGVGNEAAAVDGGGGSRGRGGLGVGGPRHEVAAAAGGREEEVQRGGGCGAGGHGRGDVAAAATASRGGVAPPLLAFVAAVVGRAVSFILASPLLGPPAGLVSMLYCNCNADYY